MSFISGCLLLVYVINHMIRNYYTPITMIVSGFSLFIVLGSILKTKPIYNKKNIIISIMLSILITVFAANKFLYINKVDTLSITNKSDDPITVDGIFLDEKSVKTNSGYNKKYDHINIASVITEYKRYNKTDSSYKMTLYKDQEYVLDVKNNKNVLIKFQKNENKTNIAINKKTYVMPKYKYSSGTKADKIYDSSYKYKFSNTKFVGINLYSILIILLSLILFFNISIRVLTNKRNLVFLLIPLVIEFNNYINITALSKVVIYLFCFLITKSKPIGFKNKWQKGLNLISSLYISFSFVGDRLINNSFNFYLLITYIILCIVMYILISYILGFMDKYISTRKIKKENTSIAFHSVVIFTILLAICYLYNFLFNSYIVHVDTYMELLDVYNGTLSNWHPYFHILLIKFANFIFGNVKFFIYLRFVFYSLLVTKVVCYFNTKGLSLKKCYIYSILLTACPVTAVMLLTLVKDIDFSLALVALTFNMYLVIKDYDYFKKNKLNYIYLLVSLVFTAVLRHNGIYIFFVVFALLFIIELKQKRMAILVTLLVSFGSVYIINSPLYQYLQVSPAPKNFDVITMIHGFNYLIVTNERIDNETYSFLTDKVLSADKFLKSYDKYNMDLLLHYSNDNLRDKTFDKKKLIKSYLKQVLKTPIPLIRDRLYGTDYVWNVSEKDGVMLYKYQIIHDEFDSNYADLVDVDVHSNKIVNESLVFISNNELLNLLLFRAGIYVDILIILIEYSIIRRRKEGFAFAPVVFNILTLMIAMGHQEYRYVWMIPLAVLVCLLGILYSKDDKNIDSGVISL